MKFVNSLNEVQKSSLEEAYQTQNQHRVRQRAQAVLLSARGYTIKQLSNLFDVQRDTVSAWLDAWAAKGLDGLEDEARTGRPLVLNDVHRAQFKADLDENPHQLKSVVARFEAETGITASLPTYKRALKNF